LPEHEQQDMESLSTQMKVEEDVCWLILCSVEWAVSFWFFILYLLYFTSHTLILHSAIKDKSIQLPFNIHVIMFSR